ncbi:MAG: NUDIX domain-containing protein [Nitrospirae bacterium]|nr:NUDIX domain-containing protein [Nitrospirota bacterium]
MTTGHQSGVPQQTLEFSAGGVAVRNGDVLLIRTKDLKGRTVWAFPKGKLNQNESNPQAALREVQEETGWLCRIERELPRSQYWFQRAGKRVRKTVRWFLMIPVEQVGEHDGEVEEAVWVPISDALTQLTYEADRIMLRSVQAAQTSPPGQSSI